MTTKKTASYDVKKLSLMELESLYNLTIIQCKRFENILNKNIDTSSINRYNKNYMSINHLIKIINDEIINRIEKYEKVNNE